MAVEENSMNVAAAANKERREQWQLEALWFYTGLSVLCVNMTVTQLHFLKGGL